MLTLLAADRPRNGRRDRQQTRAARGAGRRRWTMSSDVLDLQEIDQTQVARAGGKGAHLGELSRIEGIRVPAGFCVTTDAFRRVVADAPSIGRPARPAVARWTSTTADAIATAQRRDPPEHRGDRRPRRPGDRDHRRALPARRRHRLRGPVQRHGRGPADGLVRRPAGHVPERRGPGGDPRAREPVLGVAVHRAGGDLPPAQRRRPPHGPHGRGRAADGGPRRRPASSSRPTRSPATGGSPPSRPATASARPWSPGWWTPTPTRSATARSSPGRSATKQLAIRPVPGGGTEEQPVDPGQQAQPALTDAQVLRLVELGRRIEAHFGRPQDIEWCLADDGFQIVQSRPITTLFPVPAVRRRREPRLRLGRPPADDDGPDEAPRAVRVAAHGAPADARGRRAAVRRRHRRCWPRRRRRDGILEALGRRDPLIGDALQTIVDRDGFLPPVPDDGRRPPPAARRPPARPPRSRPIRPSSPS